MVPSGFVMPKREDFVGVARLAAPVVTVQVGLMLMGVVDTMVVGRVSATALAAVALGNLYVMTTVSFAFGMLLAVDPLVSQAIGASDSVGVRRTVQRGLILAVLLTVPVGLVLSPGETLFRLLNQSEDMVPLAAAYARLCIPGILPYLGFFVFRQTLQAMERMRPIVVTIVVANLFNVVADVILVYGWGPIPALGPLGSAWATTMGRFLLLILLVGAAWRNIRDLVRPLDRESLRLAPLRRMATLGLPIAVQVQLEFAAFSVIALLMGGMGTLEMAAHQVTINLASLTFMVPLGVSIASAVRVGHAIGAGDHPAVRRAASAALICGAGFMTGTAVVLISIPRLLARAYTNELEVIALAATLIPIAGFFQIVDGIQVVSAGVLRGAADTRAPMVINVLGFWCVGLPVSLWLGFGLGLGPQGLWWGLVAGLGVVAAFLYLRVRWRIAGDVARVVVDDPMNPEDDRAV
jgi:MATE family multidrug resistance protein